MHVRQNTPRITQVRHLITTAQNCTGPNELNAVAPQGTAIRGIDYEVRDLEYKFPNAIAVEHLLKENQVKTLLSKCNACFRDTGEITHVDPTLDVQNGDCAMLLNAINNNKRITRGGLKFYLRNPTTHIERRHHWDTGAVVAPGEPLTVYSEYMRPYTFILCMKGRCAGGKTTVSAPDRESWTEVTQPGSALLFRSELEHTTEEVKVGEKVLLKVKLWGVEQNQRIIECPDETFIRSFTEENHTTQFVFPTKILDAQTTDLIQDPTRTKEECATIYQTLIYGTLPSSVLDYPHLDGVTIGTRDPKRILESLNVAYLAKANSVSRFMQSGEGMLMANTIEEYLLFKAMFSTSPYIVPFQAITGSGAQPTTNSPVAIHDSTCLDPLVWLGVGCGNTVMPVVEASLLRDSELQSSLQIRVPDKPHQELKNVLWETSKYLASKAKEENMYLISLFSGW